MKDSLLLALGGWSFANVESVEVIQLLIALFTGGLNVWALFRATEDAKWVYHNAPSQLMHVLALKRLRQRTLFLAVQAIFLVVAIISLFLPPETVTQTVAVTLQRDYQGMAIMAVQIMLAFQSLLDYWDVKILETFPWKGADRRHGDRRVI
jgi:hypothetical protein